MTSSEFDLPTFADLPLRPVLLAAVAELGYTQPSPVQAEAIAPLVEGRDLIGQAATGTGKTAAFALPMLERLGEQRPDRRGRTAPFGLVLAPTRELALQVSEAITSYGRGMVAEKRRVRRPGGVASSISSRSSRKPMSSISSASSSTTALSAERSSTPRSRWSRSRPGVPTTSWAPPRSARRSFEGSIPPTQVAIRAPAGP